MSARHVGANAAPRTDRAQIVAGWSSKEDQVVTRKLVSALAVSAVLMAPAIDESEDAAVGSTVTRGEGVRAGAEPLASRGVTRRPHSRDLRRDATATSIQQRTEVSAENRPQTRLAERRELGPNTYRTTRFDRGPSRGERLRHRALQSHDVTYAARHGLYNGRTHEENS
jgi:hypothetical protein